jgi:uncharacterized protein (TIGR02996 family)
MTDRDRFENALGRDPADAATRLVYADWLDEHDEPALARAQRFMGFLGLHPHKYDEELGLPAWMWTCQGGLWEGQPHAWLPGWVVRLMGFREWRCYQTRAEGEKALADALGRAAENHQFREKLAQTEAAYGRPERSQTP